jgi:hypothetical protein
MRRFHILFSLNSLVVVLVSIERFSFTTHILLSPYQFLRLHEAVQMTVLILATAILPFFLLKEVTGNFSLLTKGKKSMLFLGVLFIAGIYFYASGNAFHELASFMLNQYSDTPPHRMRGVPSSSRRLANRHCWSIGSGPLSLGVRWLPIGFRMPSGTCQGVVQNIQGRIVIAIQDDSAIGTNVGPHRKRFLDAGCAL